MDQRTIAYHEAEASYWLAEAQRPIQAKGKRIALEHYAYHRDAADRLRAAAASEG